jgi:hypothetical protein
MPGSPTRTLKPLEASFHPVFSRCFASTPTMPFQAHAPYEAVPQLTITLCKTPRRSQRRSHVHGRPDARRGVSGDLAWHSGTHLLTDKAAAIGTLPSSLACFSRRREVDDDPAMVATRTPRPLHRP